MMSFCSDDEEAKKFRILNPLQRDSALPSSGRGRSKVTFVEDPCKGGSALPCPERSILKQSSVEWTEEERRDFTRKTHDAEEKRVREDFLLDQDNQEANDYLQGIIENERQQKKERRLARKAFLEKQLAEQNNERRPLGMDLKDIPVTFFFTLSDEQINILDTQENLPYLNLDQRFVISVRKYLGSFDSVKLKSLLVMGVLLSYLNENKIQQINPETLSNVLYDKLPEKLSKEFVEKLSKEQILQLFNDHVESTLRSLFTSFKENFTPEALEFMQNRVEAFNAEIQEGRGCSTEYKETDPTAFGEPLNRF